MGDILRDDEMKITLCRLDEVNEITEFIERNWNENHIFVTHPELLRWQYYRDSECVNFLVAKNGNGVATGILGFIPNNRFSPSDVGNDRVWPAIWKVTEEGARDATGLALFYHLQSEFGFRRITSIGISEMVEPIYKAMGFKIGQLRQVYMRSPYSVTGFERASLSKNRSGITSFELVSPSRLRDFDWTRIMSVKSCDYFIERYANHPYYEYHFIHFVQDDQDGFLVGRYVDWKKESVFRVVEVIDHKAAIGCNWKQLFDYLKVGTSYFDLMCDEITAEVFLDAGLSEVVEGGEIIPNYFEPLVEENVFIRYARLGFSEHEPIFKGDSDQDRPSML